MLHSFLCHFLFPSDCSLQSFHFSIWPSILSDTLAIFHSVHSPPCFIPLPVFLPFFSVTLSVTPFRPGGPSASAGQCHAGCEWHVPADGGDREAGGAASSSGGERTLLYLHRLPAACSGTAHLNPTYTNCTAAPLINSFPATDGIFHHLWGNASPAIDFLAFCVFTVTR